MASKFLRMLSMVAFMGMAGAAGASQAEETSVPPEVNVFCDSMADFAQGSMTRYQSGDKLSALVTDVETNEPDSIHRKLKFQILVMIAESEVFAQEEQRKQVAQSFYDGVYEACSRRATIDMPKTAAEEK